MWLGITTPTRPLSHYQLLGLEDFESNPAKILAAANAAQARLKGKVPGERVAELQTILDQLSMAKLVLCNSARKGQYDGQLRSKLTRNPAPAPAKKSNTAPRPGQPSGSPPRQAAAGPAAGRPKQSDPALQASKPISKPAADDYSMPPTPGRPIGPGKSASQPRPSGQPAAPSPSPAPPSGGYQAPAAPNQPAVYGAAAYPPDQYPQAPQQYYPPQPQYPPQQYAPQQYAPQQYAPQQYPQQPQYPQQYAPQPPEQYAPPQQYAPQPYATPGYPAPPEAGYAAPGYEAPAYGAQGYGAPDYGAQQGQVPPGYYAPPNAAAPGFGYPQAADHANYAQPGYTQAGYPQHNYPQPGYAQPGYPPADAVPPGYGAPAYPPEANGGFGPGASGVPDYANDPLAAGMYGNPPTPDYGAPPDAFYPPAPLPPEPEYADHEYAEPYAAAASPFEQHAAEPYHADAAHYDPTPSAAPETSSAIAAAPARPDGVVIRNSVRREAFASQEPSKPKGREPMSAGQRQALYVGGGVAAGLILLVGLIFLMEPASTAPDAAQAAIAQRPDHLNPLGERTEPVRKTPPAKPSPASDSSDDEQPSAPAAPAPPVVVAEDSPAAKPRRRPQTKPAPTKVADDAPAPKPAGNAEPAGDMLAQAPATPREKPAAGMDEGATPPVAARKKAADPEQAAAFDKEILRARGALAARDVAQAHAAVEAATPLAVTADQRERLAQVKLLTRYVEGYWNYVRKSMAGLQATDELKFGGLTVSVVAADEKELVVHRPGRNDNYTLANMPASLATALAERWFHSDVPANKIFLGAFQAVDPKGELAEARRLWSEATRDGASAERLMPLLDLPRVEPLRGAAGDNTAMNNGAEGAGGDKNADGKADRGALLQAERAFGLKHGPDMRAAVDVDKKLALARNLLDDCKISDDAAEQTVLFRSACKLVVEAVGKASTPAAATPVAEMAIEILDRALEEKRFGPARMLGQPAIIAARKSKDEALMKKANERNQKLAELGKGMADG